MKHYFINRPEFYNVYDLYSAEAGSDTEKYLLRNGYERITRKAAEKLCAEENERRKHNPSFAFSAPNTIEEYKPELLFPNDDILNSVFWDEYPVCMDERTVRKLARGWERDPEELLSHFHPATKSEIQEYGF